MSWVQFKKYPQVAQQKKTTPNSQRVLAPFQDGPQLGGTLEGPPALPVLTGAVVGSLAGRFRHGPFGGCRALTSGGRKGDGGETLGTVHLRCLKWASWGQQKIVLDP